MFWSKKYMFVDIVDGNSGWHRGFRGLSTVTVTLCRREECFSLLHSTLVEREKEVNGASDGLRCSRRPAEGVTFPSSLRIHIPTPIFLKH